MNGQTPHNIDLHQLVAKMLLGQLSDREQAYLTQLLEEKPQLKAQVERMMDDDKLVTKYERYQAIDLERAKLRFIEHCLSASEETAELPEEGDRRTLFRRLSVRPLLGYVAAAAVACLVVLSGWLWLLGNDKEMPQPVLTAEMTQSIDRLQANGMNGATLTIAGKAVQVKTAQDAKAELAGTSGGAESADNTEQGDGVPEGILSTQPDKEFWMVLDDGTYVHLNYGSRLVYPTRFVERERKVSLIGEAYFVVAKDKEKRPFIVHTVNGDVRDYGTEFNVNTKTANGTTSVILVKGKVGVTCRGGREIALQPGDMAVMGKERLPLVSKVDVTPYVSWNTGNFYFDGISLQGLMRVIGHWYNMDVAFADDAMRGIRFTGTLEKYESLHNTLHAIENVIKTPISTGEGVILIGK